MEDVLRQSEERFRTIMDSLDALVYVADRDTYELLFINKYGRDIWGNNAGKKCWQVLQSGQSGPCSFCTNDKLFTADGKPSGVYVWEFQNTISNQWYECRDQLIRWPDGRLVRMEIATDISSRKLAEKKLLQSKEEWERTFQSIGDIATILDLNLRITRVNKRACEVFSAQPEELEGKLCYQLFHDANVPCPGCPAGKSIKDFAVHTTEIEHRGLGKTFFVSASPIVDPDGQLDGIVHFAKDITDQKKLEEQLRQAQKMESIGTLAGGIAHDFNNILTPILGYAEMTLDIIPADSPAFTNIQEVLKAGNRAKDLVKQILTFSRQSEQETQPLKIQYIVKEALKLLRASIPTTIEIQQHIDPDCAAVLADPTQIHQIVMNLCTNAYHAMRKTGGVLGISLSQVEL
ncbi:MAG: PAS domain-containing sensor histidine kinase, partial [Candidatus Electrothrix sp. ATG2]|nr:PAS domain-containing sensor histidine kinase [Candidatus Electrothrix sp. ATG2]